MLNSRATQILNKLYEEEDYISVHELAELTKSSDRSVRYNLQKIDEFLNKNQIDFLERHHLKGVKLNVTDNTRKVLANFLAEHNPYQTILSKEEIQLFMTLHILINQKEMPISFFEKSLNASRTTINNISNELNEFFESKHYQFHRVPKKGIYITGDENARILDFVELFSSSLNIHEFYHYIEVGKTSSKLGDLLLKHLFNRKDLEYIKSLILYLEDQLNVMYDDKSFLMLTVYFTRLINRSRAKLILQHNEMQWKVEAKDLEGYQVSENILNKLANVYAEVEISEIEIAYLMSFIVSMKTIKTEQKTKESVSEIADRLIKEVEKYYQISFSDKREELHRLLLLHIEPMMNRIRFQLKLENPLYDEVLQAHQDLFYHLNEVCKKINAVYHIDINKQEVSYLTLHFASMMEKLREYSEGPKLLVVCVEGVAISKYLAASLTNLFNIWEIDTLPVRHITDSIVNKYDLIVSTVPLPKLDRKKVIEVNSVLTKEDIEKLKDKLNVSYNYTAENNVALVNRLVNVIQESCEIKDIYKLKYDLLTELLNRDEKKSLPNQLEVKINFSKEFVKVNLPADHWKDAINSGVGILLRNGCVAESYGEKIISNLEEFGPYMSIAPGVVLSHAGPEDGVFENSMSIVTLNQGVEFHDRFDEPVHLIITIALKEGNGHLSIVEDLIKLANNKSFVNDMLRCNQSQEIMELLMKEIDFLPEVNRG
ncbi:BglG family transcription antiterminator [Niallia oryzisoli]|uniref:BglG family transcription antiterminator n=1 Tax=Niallia oryzisoli TaxID=1737571 RepID=UPI0037361B30